ncbi:MAG: hypothetical protein ACI8UO_006515 [Verrucomicrobiales bacterium]
MLALSAAGSHPYGALATVSNCWGDTDFHRADIFFLTGFGIFRQTERAMRDLRNYLLNSFNDPGISMNELLAGATDHLGRLSARNGAGKWTARIAATSPALQAVQGALTDDLSKKANREARVLAKTNFRETNVTSELNKLLGGVTLHFGKDSPELRQVFADGLTAFNRATDDGLKPLLDQLAIEITSLQAALGAMVVTIATDLRDAWEAIYSASEDATAQKTMIQEEKNAARAALQRELFITLMHVGIEHVDEPDMLGSYFMPHLFGGPAISGTGGGGGIGGGSGGGGGASSSFPSSSSFPPSSSSSSFPIPPSSSFSSSFPSSSSSSSSFPSSSSSSSSGP